MSIKWGLIFATNLYSPWDDKQKWVFSKSAVPITVWLITHILEVTSVNMESDTVWPTCIANWHTLILQYFDTSLYHSFTLCQYHKLKKQLLIKLLRQIMIPYICVGNKKMFSPSSNTSDIITVISTKKRHFKIYWSCIFYIGHQGKKIKLRPLGGKPTHIKECIDTSWV